MDLDLKGIIFLLAAAACAASLALQMHAALKSRKDPESLHPGIISKRAGWAGRHTFALWATCVIAAVIAAIVK